MGASLQGEAETRETGPRLLGRDRTQAVAATSPSLASGRAFLLLQGSLWARPALPLSPALYLFIFLPIPSLRGRI